MQPILLANIGQKSIEDHKSWDTHLIPADDGFSRHNGQPNFPLRLANPDSQVQPGQRHLDRPITLR
jgi:hypothetical protein